MIKSKYVLKDWDCRLSDGLDEKKNGILWEKGALWNLLKSVNTVGFSGKAALLESVSFYSQMLGTTNFGLVLGDCVVFAMFS